jgi:hypothetical protein
MLKKNNNIFTFDYCLFGDYEKFYEQLCLNILRVSDIDLIGYTASVVINVDHSVPDTVIKKLSMKGANIIVHQNKFMTVAEGMMSRYSSIVNGDIYASLVRDADSEIEDVEVELIKLWLDSKYTAHIFRDHMGHVMPVMGGLFGIKSSLFMNFSKIFNSKKALYYGGYGNDQRFLSNEIYPFLRRNGLLIFSSTYVFPFEAIYMISNTKASIGDYSILHKRGEQLTRHKYTFLPYFIVKFLNYRFFTRLKLKGWWCIREVNL